MSQTPHLFLFLFAMATAGGRAGCGAGLHLCAAGHGPRGETQTGPWGIGELQEGACSLETCVTGNNLERERNLGWDSIVEPVLN